MTLIPFTPDRADDVARLEAECFGANAWSRTAVLASAAREDFVLFLAVDDDGRTLGYINGFFVCSELDICNLAVGTEDRRRGVGSFLLRGLLSWAKEQEIGRVTLDVRTSNAAAKSLYEKAGFVPCGTRRSFYAHPTEDAALYEITLPAGK
ncbi:MAG: ribosomal protein S18-alanine N-acetyltransferase [Ruminococcus sp.]|nr:ribosomal protein S18-alanine N-acetyltransferase [Candidatus Apopatosoma intestinale]